MGQALTLEHLVHDSPKPVDNKPFDLYLCFYIFDQISNIKNGVHMEQLSAPAYERLMDRLREEIISGRIKAGSRLTIQEVAKRYSLSHQPVREAFQCLKGEGLLEILPHKGARTKALDARLVGNIYDIRGVIEGLLGRLSAENFDQGHLAELESIMAELESSAVRGQDAELVSLDYKFHSTLFSMADNPEALEVYERYRGLLLSLRNIYGFGGGRVKSLIQEHKTILAALVERDATKMEELAKAHAMGAKQDLIAQMEKRQEA
jgi:DNA-binding GntR family transcriptional regulator